MVHKKKPDGSGQVMTTRGIRVFGATSRKEFFYPILKELFENIDGLSIKEIKSRIYNQFKDSFNDVDMSILRHGSPRWSKNIDWTNYDLRNECLISYNKTTKKYIITDEGIDCYKRSLIKKP